MSKDIKVILPKLGESILTATIVQWLKKVGDTVKVDEPLLEVATDKVNSEIPSPASGTVKEILVGSDQEVEVGTTLAIITTDELVEDRAEEGGEFYSPAVLRMAKEYNISLDELQGIPKAKTEERITKKDIERYVERRKLEGEVERIEMSKMRQTISENMVRSFYTAPHASLVCEIDMTDIVEYIQREKQKFFQRNNAKLTVTSFVAQAMAKAVQSYPLINSSLEDDNIVIKHFVNLGIAVSLEQGLIVPVIKNCHNLSLTLIAKAIYDLAIKARTNRLKPDDVEGGTITLSNFGKGGATFGIPIIRRPEVAMVGMGAISKRPIAIDDAVVLRHVIYLSLTFDHRVIDGMYGSAFLQELKSRLERKVL